MQEHCIGETDPVLRTTRRYVTAPDCFAKGAWDAPVRELLPAASVRQQEGTPLTPANSPRDRAPPHMSTGPGNERRSAQAV